MVIVPQTSKHPPPLETSRKSPKFQQVKKPKLLTGKSQQESKCNPKALINLNSQHKRSSAFNKRTKGNTDTLKEYYKERGTDRSKKRQTDRKEEREREGGERGRGRLRQTHTERERTHMNHNSSGLWLNTSLLLSIIYSFSMW